jgi:regulator of protease activity HflC (stomatin/prohibitin superfamily)
MTQYGYGIVRALVNDIDPDEKVKAAMNEINAATRLRKAAEERGEAERILKVKQAQGDAEANVLHGEGIAGQRKAIIDGLGESVENFEQAVPGASINDVMQLILMTQYFDMLKEVGASSRGNTILLPHTPGGLAEIMSQVRDSIITGNVAAATHNEASGAAVPNPNPRPTSAPTPPRRPAPMPKPDGAVPPTPMPPPAPRSS